MSEGRKEVEREKARLALALASVAGFVDAVGYITLDRLFTAHMSGNTARLGVFLGHGDFPAALPMVAAVTLFVLGIALGTVAGELAARRGVRSIAAVILGLQAVLLAAFMLYGSLALRGDGVNDHSLRGFYVLAALAIVSLSFQTCAIKQVAGKTVRTTYLTGVLTNMTQEAINYLFWLRDGDRREREGYLERVLGLGSRRESLERAALLGGIWCLYLAGAVGGSYAESLWRYWSLVFPLGVLVVAIAADLWRPIDAVEPAVTRSGPGG